MRNPLAMTIVFTSGFAIMVLEIIGARFLARDFGGSFYVWVSQIGVVLIALALGYFVGGAVADHFQKAKFLAALLAGAGVFILLIPDFAPRLLERIVLRHPADQEVPIVWQKLDPAIGSALVFLLPCFVLAMPGPYMIRLLAQQLTNVGKLSGVVYAASTIGSIAGVFVSGYLLIDHLNLSYIFRATGVLTLGLAALCFGFDRLLAAPQKPPTPA